MNSFFQKAARTVALIKILNQFSIGRGFLLSLCYLVKAGYAFLSAYSIIE